MEIAFLDVDGRKYVACKIIFLTEYCWLDIFLYMSKTLNVILSIGMMIHGVAMASTAFIDFETRSVGGNGTSFSNNILSVILGNNMSATVPQNIITTNTTIGDYQNGAQMLTLSSATFLGCNGGANLTSGDFNNSNYPKIYEAFGVVGSSVWGDNIGRLNTSGGNSMALTFSNLAANTEYTFYLMGGRTGAQAAYCPAFSNVNLLVDGAGITASTFGAAATSASLNGGSVGMYKWTFTTGRDWTADKIVALSTGNGVYSALRIDAHAVPESSTVTLGLVPMVALLLRRRRKQF